MSASPETWRQALLAACLWSDGVASHRTAAALWKLGGIEPRWLEVTSSKKLKSRTAILHSAVLTPSELTTIGNVPVTTPTRTLLDVAAVLEQDEFEACLADAFRMRLTTPDRLRRLVDETCGKGRRGSKHVRSALATTDSRVESILEYKVLRLLRRSKLPPPTGQFEVRDDEKLLARVDFAYPEIKLAIEADGFRHHGEWHAWKRDLRRRNALTTHGWHVIHVTWDDVVNRPHEIMAEIQSAVRMLTGQTSFFPS
jgi:very-short-patch-repair endonuclease